MNDCQCDLDLTCERHTEENAQRSDQGRGFAYDFPQDLTDAYEPTDAKAFAL